MLLRQADARIVGGWQRLQVEARAAGAQGHLSGSRVDIEHGVFRKSTEQILELARSDGDRLILLAREFTIGSDLHLEIGRGDEQPAVLLLEQYIGKNRQRLPALDDS